MEWIFFCLLLFLLFFEIQCDIQNKSTFRYGQSHHNEQVEWHDLDERIAQLSKKNFAPSPQSTLPRLASCSDISCGIPLYNLDLFDENERNVTHLLNRPCTRQDIGSRASSCIDGLRTIYFFYKPPVLCSGGEILPQPIQIPCNLQCENGKVYNTTSMSCETCPPGSMIEYNSILGNKIELSTRGWPSQFSTWCNFKDDSATQVCDAWRIRDDYIDSGYNFNAHNVYSELKYVTEVAENSVISFDYQVFGEKFFLKLYDYFEFTIRHLDSKMEITKFREAEQYNWTTLSFPVKAGNVEFVWSYTKDVVASTTFPEGDRAMIRNITITNQKSVILSCKPCPPGSSTIPGENVCVPCPINTYAPEEGTEKCLPCPKFQRSNQGSTSCEPIEHFCSSNDMYELQTPCINLESTLYYKWITPLLCKPIVLPTNITVPCRETCLPGEMKIGNLPCHYCSLGSKSKAGEKCTTCPLDSYPSEKVYYIKNFDKFLFRTGCEGECASGWRSKFDRIESGPKNGISSTWLEFDFKLEQHQSEIHIDYIFNCTGGREVHFLRDDKVIGLDFCPTFNTSTSKSIIIAVPGTQSKGSHVNSTSRIRIVHNRFTPLQSIHDSLEITNMKFKDVTYGGATSCSICPPGSTIIDSDCVKCPAGHSTNSSQEKCTPCPSGTFSREGTICVPCGSSMNSPSGSANCTWIHDPENYKQKSGDLERIYNLKELSQEVDLHYVYIDGWRYFLNLQAHFDYSKNSNAVSAWKRSDALHHIQSNLQHNSFSISSHITSKKSLNSFFQELKSESQDSTTTHTNKLIDMDVKACHPDSFACRVNEDGDVEDLGVSAEFKLDPKTNVLQLVSENHFRKCPTLQSEYTKVTIDFVCSSPGFQYSVQQIGPCSYHYVIESHLACPICTPDMFIPWRDNCNSNGEAEIVYLQKTLCYSGYSPPENIMTTEGCNDITLPRTIWTFILFVVGGLVVVVGILVIVCAIVSGIAFIIYKKNIALKAETYLLQQTREGLDITDEDFELSEIEEE